MLGVGDVGRIGRLGLQDRRAAGFLPPIAMTVWIDPRNLSSMRQEITGASATTAAVVDSPVGSVLNLGSLGGWFQAPATGARPILRNSGARYWLEFDGTDDSLNLAGATTSRYFAAGGQYTTGQVALGNIACLGQNTAGSAVRLNGTPDAYNQTDSSDHNFGGSNTINGAATLSVAINTDHVIESVTDGTDRSLGTIGGAITLTRFWKGRVYPCGWNATIPSAGGRLLLRQYLGAATGVSVI
jgi:hypothetical protein